MGHAPYAELWSHARPSATLQSKPNSCKNLLSKGQQAPMQCQSPYNSTRSKQAQHSAAAFPAAIIAAVSHASRAAALMQVALAVQHRAWQSHPAHTFAQQVQSMFKALLERTRGGEALTVPRAVRQLEKHDQAGRQAGKGWS